jgi:hypothetical protein
MKISYTKIFRSFILLSASLLSITVKAVSVNAISQGSLPGVLVEASALDFNGSNGFWSLNDSGDPSVYKVNDNGTLVQTVDITGAHVRNWEEITHDSARTYMYIGDFGNNGDDRTNLRIFRIPYPSASVSTVAAEEIDYNYSDQTQFPSHWLNFDAEAFVHYRGKLYIFTKADGNAIGYTKMYELSDQPGSQTAFLVDSFYTNDRTTGASISPDGTSLVLISNTHIHLFRNFTGSNFFGGQHTQINIAGSWTQKEGVSFGTDRDIYLADENSGSGNHLYYVDLSNWIPPTVTVTTGIEKINDDAVSVYPMPANQFVNINVRNVNEKNLSISLFDITGKSIYTARIENTMVPFTIHTSDFPSGIYFYRVYSDALEMQTSRLIISH